MSILQEFQIIKTLGAGTYGNVYECTADIKGYKNKRWAIKVIKINNIEPIPCLFEVTILTKIYHRYLVSARWVDIDDSNLYIVLDLGDTDMHSWSRKLSTMPRYISTYSDGVALNSKKLKIWVHQLLQALAVLHSENILHGDIKPANILLYDEDVKLSDYSIARKLPTKWNSCLYTITHRPPEVWLLDEVTLSSDIWALGCTLVEIATGKLLFPHQNDYNMKSEAVSMRYIKALYEWKAPFKQVDGYIDTKLVDRVNVNINNIVFPSVLYHDEYRDFIDLLSHMLQNNPSHRWPASKLLSHPWFKDMEILPYALVEGFHINDSPHKEALAWMNKRLNSGIIENLGDVNSNTVVETARRLDFRV